MGCTMLRSHAAPDNMLDVASRRCGRTGEDGVAAGGPVRPGRRGCSMGFQVSVWVFLSFLLKRLIKASRVG